MKMILYALLAGWFSGLVITQAFHGDWVVSATLLPLAVVCLYKWQDAASY